MTETIGEFSYSQIIAGIYAATKGAFGPDRIECSRPVLEMFLEHIYHPWMDTLGIGTKNCFEIDYDSEQNERQFSEWRQRVLSGELPLRFHAAQVVEAEVPADEIRFINERCPERNHTLRLIGANV